METIGSISTWRCWQESSPEIQARTSRRGRHPDRPTDHRLIRRRDPRSRRRRWRPIAPPPPAAARAKLLELRRRLESIRYGACRRRNSLLQPDGADTDRQAAAAFRASKPEKPKSVCRTRRKPAFRLLRRVCLNTAWPAGRTKARRQARQSAGPRSVLAARDKQLGNPERSGSAMASPDPSRLTDSPGPTTGPISGAERGSVGGVSESPAQSALAKVVTIASTRARALGELIATVVSTHALDARFSLVCFVVSAGPKPCFALFKPSRKKQRRRRFQPRPAA